METNEVKIDGIENRKSIGVCVRCGCVIFEGEDYQRDYKEDLLCSASSTMPVSFT